MQNDPMPTHGWLRFPTTGCTRGDGLIPSSPTLSNSVLDLMSTLEAARHWIMDLEFSGDGSERKGDTIVMVRDGVV